MTSNTPRLTGEARQIVDQIGHETDYKLTKMRQVATSDRELIEMQRKTIYL